MFFKKINLKKKIFFKQNVEDIIIDSNIIIIAKRPDDQFDIIKSIKILKINIYFRKTNRKHPKEAKIYKYSLQKQYKISDRFYFK